MVVGGGGVVVVDWWWRRVAVRGAYRANRGCPWQLGVYLWLSGSTLIQKYS